MEMPCLLQSDPQRWNPQEFGNTVFDVGLHDGSDTAFYLHQGHAVLAIEADPTLAAAAAHRFRDAIRSGQLHILNVGIAERRGTATFWICDDNSVWNSLDVRIASRNGSRHHSITIQTLRFADVVSAFGVPEYLKIDIEGADGLCVQDLQRGMLPRFISVESECVGDGEKLTDDEAVRMLSLLYAAGYRRFKLVSQDDFRTVSSLRWSGVRRLIDSAAYGKLRRLGLERFAERLSTRGRLERANGGYRFSVGGTGPFGHGLLGDWSAYESARKTYLALRSEYFGNTDAMTYAFWYDWHATF